MAGVPSNDLLSLTGFRRGLNNLDREESIPKDALRAAVNVDLDDMGKLSRRLGYGLVHALSDCHSLWSHYDHNCLFRVAGSEIQALNSSLQVIDQQTLQRPGNPVSYALAAGRTYWSNEYDSGVFADGFADWAVEQPGGNADVAPAVGIGGLEAGIYQVTATFVHADGRESGAALATEITVPQGGGIALSNIPTPLSPNIQFVRLYRTTHNGDVLYLATDLPAGLDSCLLGHQQLGRALETQFLSAMPAGQIVRAHNGRLLVAAGNVLFWSEAMNYGLTRITENYIAFNDRITMMESVGHAGNVSLYVAAGKRTYSILGADPKEWARTVVAPHGAVPGASTHIDAKSLGLDTTGEVAVWLGTDGCLVAGLQGGLLVRLHDRNYLGPEDATRGALAARDLPGITQMIALHSGGNASRMAASDIVEAEVWKDGRRIR